MSRRIACSLGPPTSPSVSSICASRRLPNWARPSATAVTCRPHPSARSRTLVSGGFDKELLWWKPGDGAEPVRRVKAGARVNRLASSPDGKLLATAHDDLVCRLWEADPGKAVVDLRDGHPRTTRIGRKN